MKVELTDVDEVIDARVEGYKTSTRVSVPKKYANRRVKIVILKDES
ncbi:DUF2080 family transposase-associated protein [Candidatus Woesearchaeota archaeon]|nr:DUF2080 family transposase-associated protein [Candidatus Woesearchaeota archaeon]